MEEGNEQEDYNDPSDGENDALGDGGAFNNARHPI
jgi:hypothetical protein